MSLICVEISLSTIQLKKMDDFLSQLPNIDNLLQAAGNIQRQGGHDHLSS